MDADEAIDCHSYAHLRGLQVNHLEFNSLRPPIRALHHSCDEINDAALVARSIRTTECNRFGATTIYLQRKAGVSSISNKANTHKGDSAEEKERIRIPNPCWRQVINEGGERLG